MTAAPALLDPLGWPRLGVVGRAARARPLLVHVTTTDMSLDWLLGPQLEAFAASGFEVVGMSAAGDHVAAIEARGIRHLALRHATRAMDPRRDVAALGELVRAFARIAPDVVHTHNPKPGVYGRVAARLAGVPAVVNTVHGLYASPDDALARRAVVYGLERMAAACSDHELVQNVEDVEVLRSLGVPAAKLTVLGNGIDLDRFVRPPDEAAADRRGRRAAWGVADDEVVVGLVGRLVVEKGYREVFEAAATLRAEGVRARFVVIGPSDPDKADALGAAELAAAQEAGVVLAGRRDDVEHCYPAMDCYVLASWREGFPRSAMEAAAAGLPIVATDIRGCRQVVDHGATGLLVPPRDPAALAGAIARVVRDTAGRAAMGAAARAKAQRDFDQRTVIDRTLEVYDRVLHAAARRAG